MIRINFRENWWKHYCYVIDKVKWIHKQYKACSLCKTRKIGTVVHGAETL